MYNYQKYLHDSRIADDLKRISEQFLISEEHRSQRIHQMINNHDKRIEHSIVQLIQNPVKVDQYKNQPYCPREINRKKWIVDNDMAFNYERQPIRIIRSLKKNSSLDLIPFTNSCLYQFRKESPLNSLRKNRKRSLQNSCVIQNYKSSISQSGQNKINKDRQLYRRSNDYLPPLSSKNFKTYFHTLETIVNKPDFINVQEVNQPQKGKKQGSQNILQPMHVFDQQKNNENTKQLQKMKIDKIKKCKLVLQKCGLLPKETVYQPLEFKKQTPR